LFSRYWREIDGFQNKRITEIQMRFPDATMIRGADNQEAIEFEYNLKSFYAHVPTDQRRHGDLKKLEDYGALYIVYWEEDADVGALRKRIAKHFAGKVFFVRLSKYFSPLVEHGPEHLVAYWQFTPGAKRYREVYSFDEIKEETARLIRDEIVEEREVQRGLYRVSGFNTAHSDYIECDHWKTIHYYTTGYFSEGSVPERLFLKPKGSKRFLGYFKVKQAFVIKKDDKLLDEFYKNFYFYAYSPGYREGEAICLVYTQFVGLDEDRGEELYNYLRDKDYWLRQTSEIIEDKHMKVVRRISG